MNCLYEKCTARATSRGLCRIHYDVHYRAGTLDEFGLSPKTTLYHKLSDIDKAGANTEGGRRLPRSTGVCSVCGPTPVALAAPGNEKPAYWYCLSKERIKRQQKPNKYGRTLRYGKDGTIISAETKRKARERMEAEQQGRCKICDRQTGRLDLDHCHKTGKLRGLLCVRCNTLLGKYEKNPEFFTRMLAYLEDNN